MILQFLNTGNPRVYHAALNDTKREILRECVGCDNKGDEYTQSLLVYRTHWQGEICTYYGCTQNGHTTQPCGDVDDIECSAVMLVCAASARDLQLLIIQMYAAMRIHIQSQASSFSHDLLQFDPDHTLGYGEVQDKAEDVIMTSVRTWDLRVIEGVIGIAARLTSDAYPNPFSYPGVHSYHDVIFADEVKRFRAYVIRRLVGNARSINTIVAMPAVSCVNWLHRLCVPRISCSHECSVPQAQ